MNESKPIKTCCGGFETDSNFNIKKFTKSQVTQIANARLKRNKIFGCKKVTVIDKLDYWAISIQ